MGFVFGQGSIRLDKLVPMSTKNLLNWLDIFTFSYYSIFTNMKFVGIFCLRFSFTYYVVKKFPSLSCISFIIFKFVPVIVILF